MSTRAASSPIRADLQGLRAVAVALVVAFHLRPDLVPGGFVGVDVFFAISGFLITAHLLREIEVSGTVRLGRFWARRARRLLPAALTVLIVTLTACWLLAPVGDLPRFVRETVWSTLYIENWALAGSSVDYLAAEAAPSPVQHFWSLSVEEQFYVGWPLLLLASTWVSARALRRRSDRRGSSPRALRTGMAVALGSVLLASLLWSIVYTAQDSSPAYFATTTRAWEFAAGGLLAVLVACASKSAPVAVPVRAAVAWAGLIAVVTAAFAYSETTPFPSLSAALPVVGTLAVIWAAVPVAPSSPTTLLAMRPVQWLGDRSYAVYLWHWPVLVVGGFVLSRSANPLDLLMMLALTVLLAEATTRWIERPVRFGVGAAWRPGRVLGAAAAAMSIVLVAAGLVLPGAEARVVAEQVRIEQLVAAPPSCFGAAELLDAASCDEEDDAGNDDIHGDGADPGDDPASVVDVEARSVIVPDPSLADAPPERCITDIRSARFEVCSYGASAEEATRTVALVGDSHAEQWLPAFVAAAEAGGWRLLVAAKSSCPFSGAERTEPALSSEVLAEMRAGCLSWNREVLALLAEQPSIDTVVVSARGRNPVVAPDGERWQDVAAAAYAERWAVIPATVEHIVVLRDTPTMADDVLTCVRDEADPGSACARDRTDALVDDPQFDAAVASDDRRVRPLDLTDGLCAPDECSPVIGDVLAYRDSHHLSWVYAATLGPAVRDALDGLPDAASAAVR